MATNKDTGKDKSHGVPEAPPIVDPARTGTATLAPGKHPRIAGRLAHPVYLIHNGNFEIQIPAETREVLETDPESEDFGNVIIEEVTPEYSVKGQLPKDSKYGARKIGVAHEIWDAAEAEALKAKGFVTASSEEVKKSSKMSTAATRGNVSVDEIAKSERERAIRQLNNQQHGVVQTTPLNQSLDEEK